MRLGILSDIHGHRKHLKLVKKAMQQHRVDHIYCLGDIFECKISKKRMSAAEQFTFADSVVDNDPKLYKHLHQMSCIIGNQEERIRQLLPLCEFDGEMTHYLTLPPVIETLDARLEHGHTFLNEQDWRPYPTQMHKHLLFYGHTHESGIYQMNMENDRWIPTPIDFTYGTPVQLSPDIYYAINVGAIVNTRPEWLLYEESSCQITFYQELPIIYKHS
ncbi:metallophosphoesterase family protein [Brevibacillus dissolubilis]|uniref:metallophosphoesterase family protein n=1 Tax=Brevibacillus dissolubilis TaxID=1844116 RepID=UPI0011168517|nr:metallophosphoesterase family protein [Brevibacillus dissolubilis]